MSTEIGNELRAKAEQHFNEPMLSFFDVVRCIGYGEDENDCYFIARRPGGKLIWLTCCGGYTFLDRLAGQNPFIYEDENWDDLKKLDNMLMLNGAPKEPNFIVDFRHDDPTF